MPTVFKVHADGDVTKNVRAVLYSEEIITGGSDNLFRTYLGLVRSDRGVRQLGKSVDLTEFIPVFTARPGNVARVSGSLDMLRLRGNMIGVHVNIWGVISGSGSISAGSDLVFRVDGEGLQSTPVLQLVESFRFEKARRNIYWMKDMDIFVTNDRDDSKDIIVQLNETIRDGDAPAVTRLTGLELYTLVQDRYTPSGRPSKMPLGAVKLSRSPDVIEMRTLDR